MITEFTGFATPQQREAPYSISEINAGIASLVESAASLVWVHGEISNFKHASSGHSYLRLKDANSQIPAVIWRGNMAKVNFDIEDGMEVMAIAAIRVYQRGGYYQLDIIKMQPTGVGALFAAYEKLKKKLAAEGLFDDEHKKELPRNVQTVGVVTSRTGAALKDILHVIAQRAPTVSVLLCHASVQGKEAAPQIVEALRMIDDHALADVIIVGRGGGSIEDLWVFNDESVARAIHAASLPVISAVGHEIDFTIADFVADMRAPTPSAAAEMAVPDYRELHRYFTQLRSRFTTQAVRALTTPIERYRSVQRSPAFRRTIHAATEARQTRDLLGDRLVRSTVFSLSRARSTLGRLAAQLDALSPLAILSRGYSVVRAPDGTTVKTAESLKPSEQISIQFATGSAQATVDTITTDSAEARG